MIKSVLLTLALGYATVVLLLYVFQRNLMYFPGGAPGLPTATLAPEMTVHAIVAGDRTETISWFARPPEGGKIVVFYHGNAGNIGDRDFKARHFIDRGYGVMLVGYRGFGGSAGKPTEAGLYADARAAIAFLQSEGYGPRDLVLYGESMGSGIAVQMAKELAESDTSVSGVILEAPFTSMADAAAFHYPWLPARLLVRDRYDSLAKIGNIDAPLLVIHGDLDRTVPEPLGKQLFSAAIEPKEGIWLGGAGHVNLYDFDLLSPMLDWLDQLPVQK